MKKLLFLVTALLCIALTCAYAAVEENNADEKLVFSKGFLEIRNDAFGDGSLIVLVGKNSVAREDIQRTDSSNRSMTMRKEIKGIFQLFLRRQERKAAN